MYSWREAGICSHGPKLKRAAFWRWTLDGANDSRESHRLQWSHLERRRLTRSCANERTNDALTEATSSEEILSRRRAAARWRASSAFASSMFSAVTAISVR